MKHWYILFFSCVLFAQNDSIKLLDEVKIYGNFSPKLNTGYQTTIITDSIINNKQQSLGNLLQNQANLYFKQNGSGMVSSVSLRGSGASHTGVYWNGIAINSSLNGQTDFNTLSANGFDQIEIRKGAGSVLFGSGAIGGTINLRDKIHFISKKSGAVNIGVASYSSQNMAIKARLSNRKFYTKIAMDGVKSDNNYPYLGTNIKNENGAYKNYHLKSVFAYKLNKNNQIQFFTNYSNNDRNLSRTIVAPNNSKYKNEDARIMLHWKNFGLSHNSSLKIAYLNENYHFFLNKENTNSSFGKTENYIIKYDYKYFFKKNISFHSGLENKLTKGIGTDIQEKERNNLEVYFLMHQKPIKRLNYNLSVRKGISSIYKIPFIYAIDAKYDISSKVALKTNYSTNYKLPTFNDLFWFASGNEDLQLENSNSLELGLVYKAKQTNIGISSYLIKSKELIQWRPVTSSFWRPVNIQNTTSYGLELEFNTTKKIGNHKLVFQSQYAYTVSKDKALEKQLIYVPYHKANVMLDYIFKDWSANVNQQYNGKVFTTTSNTETVTDFWLTNIQLNKKINKVNIGFIMKNIFNIKYETVAYRPMPNRNYSIQLTLKF